MTAHAPRFILAMLAAILCASAHAEGMTFEFGEHCEADHCQSALYARGAIEADTAERFKQATANQAPGLLVVLDSRGGNLSGGLGLGEAIRRRGFNTRIETQCMSACAYAFLGGVERRVPEGARFGVHQFRSDEKLLDSSAAQRVSAMLGRYFDLMGVDRKVMDLANLTPSERAMVLNRAQLTALRVDNSESPTARWRLEATEQGRLIAIVSQVLGARDAISFGLTREVGGFRLLVLMRGALPATALGARMPLTLVVDSARFTLPSASPWRLARDGQQIAFDLPDAAVQSLLALSEKSSFTFEAEWPRPVNAQTLGTLRLSAAGLRNAINAMKNAAILPAATTENLP